MPRETKASPIHLISLLTCALLLLGSVAGAANGPNLNLDDVFAADGILAEVLGGRTFAEYEPLGPPPFEGQNFTYFDRSFWGPKFWGFCNPDLIDPCDCDCTLGVDPCDTPGDNPIMKQARITYEAWIPSSIDFESPPVLLVWKVGARTTPEYVEKTLVAKNVAKKGGFVTLWDEVDMYPVGAEPVPKISVQYGYAGPASFQRAALKWMHDSDPTSLTAEELRWDDRYENAQSNMHCTSFFQKMILDYFDNDPAVADWLDTIQVVYAGGSKTGGGAITASGVDPRAIAMRADSFQDLDGSVTSGTRRYSTDWMECPVVCPVDDPCSAVPVDAHRWTRHAAWAWEYRNETPSYIDIYRVERDPTRYEHLLFLETVGSHDWINPIGSEVQFWSDRDGLTGGVPSAEEWWNFRILRRPNQDHGLGYPIGFQGNFEVKANILMTWSMMLHLIRGKALPRMESGDMLDVSGDPATEPWTVRVRLTGTQATHDPLTDESFKIHVAFSDDRDFRRCSDPIQCRTGPCDESPTCREGALDDNKEEEDKFIAILDPTVVIDGEFRDLIFDAPAEALVFTDPLTAVIVEAKIEGGMINKLHDDWVMTTEVIFANTELYAPHDCCP